VLRAARSGALAAGLASALVACALQPPAATKPDLRTTAPLSATVMNGATEWPSADWWKRYGDPVLDLLITQALRGAPSLGTADARFASARESVRVTGAAQGVQVDASGSLQRQRISDNGLFPPQFLGFNWYNQSDIGITARYSFDWWGKQRAGIAAAVDEARAARAEQAAASLMLAAAVADSYFGWQADQQRLRLAQERLDLQAHQEQVVSLRLAAQLETGDAQRQLRMEMAQTRENIALLEGSARLRVVALAGLLGSSPEDLPPFSAHPLPAGSLALPESARLDLIARRPDIRASRWRVEAATKNLDVARAEYLPDVSIHALAGLSSIEIGKLLQAGSAVPQLGAAINLPLFDSGLRDARYGVRRAQVAAAAATYDETVVAAAREVATAASMGLAVESQRQQRALQLKEAQALVDSAAARQRAGLTDIRQQLAAGLALNASRDVLTQLNLAALSADVALNRALGGGYVEREEAP
jgi:multidrug efflux system outer membrane protein